jgi:hypothetical protein
VSGEDRDGKKQRTVGLPNHVEKGRAGDVDGAYTHTLQVVEVPLEAANVAAEAEVDFIGVVFKDGAKKIVVSWVTICELVEKERIEGKCAPVLWRGGVGGIWSRGGIVEDGGIWVCVDIDIPLDKVGLVVVCIGGVGEGEGKGSEDEGRKGGGHCDYSVLPIDRKEGL